MPASLQARLPASSASAVSATMGVRARPAARLAGADGAGRFDAVHAGHVDVGEQKIETRSSSIACTAALPVVTSVTAWPRRRSNSRISSMLMGLSSARRMRRPSCRRLSALAATRRRALRAAAGWLPWGAGIGGGSNRARRLLRRGLRGARMTVGGGAAPISGGNSGVRAGSARAAVPRPSHAQDSTRHQRDWRTGLTR